ncbi:thioredoxin, partial [Streptomyces sp. SID11233]|nr:thioredoxin [Streptomyces sp. SID11233]
WAGAAKLVRAHLETVSDEYADRLTPAVLDIDQNPGTLPRYEETAIPVLMFFRDGAVAGKRVGAQSEGQIREFLDSLL